MSKRNTLSAFFGTIGCAVRAANSVEANRSPRARDLQTLGIDPVQFRNIAR